MTASRHRRSAPSITRLAWLWVLLLAICPGAFADQLEIQLSGLEEPLLGNVRIRVQSLYVGGELRLTARRRQTLAAQAERTAAMAVRPYGYYRAAVRSKWDSAGESVWRLELTVDPGPPLRISESFLDVAGPGASLPELREWQRDWPLGVGQVMDQTTWEAHKQAALDLAEMHGYLGAQFSEHAIAIDLEQNTAATRLVLDTGQQAVLGDIRYEQDAVRPRVLELLPRFSAGQAYDAWLLEKFRLDLWRTGYFDNIEVIEERRLEEDPPRVNFVVRADRRMPNTYQGSLGWGTDTGIRAQLMWSRHLLSDRGDYFDMGLGWQEKFNQYSFRSSYRLPRETRAREFWTADFLVNRQRQDVQIKQNVTDEEFIQLTSGDVTDYSVKAGRLIVRDIRRGYQQIFETWFGQYVYETVSFDLTDVARQLGYGDPEDELGEYSNTLSALALGVNWDWPDVRGVGFETVGHHQRAWLTIANEAWGSNRDFNQAYLSSSWHGLWGERWKWLLRGEAGYTDADVRDVEVAVGGSLLQLSVTELPNLYRFKAGGSRSVRGYAFESLSNNNIGSNNIVTASAEIEMKFRRDWSLAAFFDAGNAFNDWSDFELLKGAGVGIRWYSIAGAIRLDVANGLDLEGEPWRVHFTIGTPLL
jgi:translocation and assembly module TamA